MAQYSLIYQILDRQVRGLNMNTQFAFHDLKIRTHPEIYLSFDSSIRSAISSLGWIQRSYFSNLTKCEYKRRWGLWYERDNSRNVLSFKIVRITISSTKQCHITTGRLYLKTLQIDAIRIVGIVPIQGWVSWALPCDHDVPNLRAIIIIPYIEPNVIEETITM